MKDYLCDHLSRIGEIAGGVEYVISAAYVVGILGCFLTQVVAGVLGGVIDWISSKK